MILKSIIFIFTILSFWFKTNQTDQFLLPQEFYEINIGKSTEKEVQKIIGKPSERNEITKNACHKIKIPTVMYFQYEDKKIEMMFRRKNKKSDYILQTVFFLEGSSVKFGGNISIGTSTREDIFKRFGKPKDYLVGSQYIFYYSDATKNHYTFLTDEKGKLIRVTMCKNENCL